jgi:hypothetical protein
VNGDGAVTVADAAVLLRVAAGFDDGSGLVMALADLAPAAPGGAAGYGDGVINLADVARVARAAAGTETLP